MKAFTFKKFIIREENQLIRMISERSGDIEFSVAITLVFSFDITGIHCMLKYIKIEKLF